MNLRDLVFLTLVTPAVSLHAEENRLRHLIEQWPYERVKVSNEAGSSKSEGFAQIVLASKKEDYGQRLKTLTDVATQSREKCGAALSLAVSSLRDRWFEERQNEYICAVDNCVEALDAMDLLDSQLNELEVAVRKCSESSLRLWFNENETDLDIELGLSARQARNPQWLQSGVDAYWVLLPRALVSGAYRAKSTWHSANLESSFWSQPTIGNDLQFSLFQEHGYSFLGGTEWKLSSRFDKRTEWLQGTYAVPSYGNTFLDLQLKGRFNLFGEEEERVVLAYENESWDNNLWDNTKWKVSFHSYFEAPLATTSYLELRVRKETDASSLSYPDLWAFALLYSIRAEIASDSEVMIDLGLEDIRVSDEGARLWPIFSVLAEGGVLGFNQIRAGASVFLLPEANHWSRASLKLGTSLSTSYVASRISVPFTASLYKYLHRGAPGGRRDDILLSFAMNPSLEINEKTKLSAFYEVEHLWGGAAPGVLPFPVGGTHYKLGAEWTYAF